MVEINSYHVGLVNQAEANSQGRRWVPRGSLSCLDSGKGDRSHPSRGAARNQLYGCRTNRPGLVHRPDRKSGTAWVRVPRMCRLRRMQLWQARMKLLMLFEGAVLQEVAPCRPWAGLSTQV